MWRIDAIGEGPAPGTSAQSDGPGYPILAPLAAWPPLGQASSVTAMPPPLAFFLLLISGWVNRQQQEVIDYLLEENRVLRADRSGGRLRLTDDQRRRLAIKARVLGRRRLGAVAGIVTPDTLMRWYRRLVAKKYDGSKKRLPGRPSTKPDIAALVARMANGRTRLGATPESAVG